jgi:hypothetical protein
MRVRPTLLLIGLLGTVLSGLPQVTAPPGSAQRPGQAASPRQPGGSRPRDRGVLPKGTALLQGTVVAADTGSPLRRATVRLSAPAMRDGRVASTDASGRFEFRELPGGRYQLSASKTGFVQLSYGQRQPYDPSRSLEISEGETLRNVSLALPRAGVITGRVLDEFGEAVPDAMVQALRFQYARGRRRLVPAGRFAQSNDIGVYRVYGLAPGQYFVAARATGHGPDRAEDVTGFAPTYYPGTTNASEAQPVSVGVGQEVNAEFQLVAARLARVLGTVVDSAGRPLTSGTVSLTQRVEGASVPAFGGNTSRVDEDGSFTLSAVPPGTYTLTASSSGRRGPQAAGDEGERGVLPVTVFGEDIENIVVQTSRGLVLAGRITTDGGPAGFTPEQVGVQVESRDQDDGPMSFSGRADVQSDGSFELVVFPGARALRVTSVPDGWQLKRALLGGEDVTDTGFEVKPGQPLPSLRIVLTSQVTEIAGTVADARGDAVRDFTVVIFPEDRALWDVPSDRYLRWARSGKDGRYRAEGLPPGDYLAVAAESIEDPRTTGPEGLEALRAAATAVRLGDGERKVVPLKLSAP